jgi:hypothetical protein
VHRNDGSLQLEEDERPERDSNKKLKLETLPTFFAKV